MQMRRDWLRRANTEIISSVVRCVPDDAYEPCAEFVRFATLVQPLYATDEGILANILRIEPISNASKRDNIRRAKVPPEQCLHGGGIAQARSCDERSIGFRHSSIE